MGSKEGHQLLKIVSLEEGVELGKEQRRGGRRDEGHIPRKSTSPWKQFLRTGISLAARLLHFFFNACPWGFCFWGSCSARAPQMRFSWRSSKKRTCKLAQATSVDPTLCGDSPRKPCTAVAEGDWGSGFGSSTSKLWVQCPAQQHGQGGCVRGGEGFIRGEVVSQC